MKRFSGLKKMLLTSIGLLFSFTLYAQFRPDIDVQEWPVGTVTLTTGETIKGVITYYRTQDIISVLSEDGKLTTHSPVNVAQFEVSSGFSNRNHVFKTIYWDQGKDFSDFKKPTFFEQLSEGKATLLMRESYYKRTIDTYITDTKQGTAYDPLGYPISEEYIDQIKPKYYVLKPDGDVVMLNHTRKDFLAYCGKKAPIVKSYARKKKLGFEETNDFIAIVNYYNTL